MQTAEQHSSGLGRIATPAPSPIHGIWQLAWPSITSFALQSVVGLVDLVFVSRLGSDAVAGVGVGSQFQFVMVALIAGVSTGTVALVARATGAGNRAEAGQVLRASLFLATILGVALMAAAPFTERGVALFRVDPAVVAIGGSYLRIVLMGSVPLALSVIFAGALRGAGDVRVPLLVGLAMNVANVVGDYALIFGHFGAPAMGADGAALATALCFTLGAAAYLALWRRDALVIGREHLLAGFDRGLYRRILRVGTPTCAEQLSFHGGLLLFLSVFSTFGTAAVAAYIIGVRVISFSLIPGMGFQIAAATLVGQHLGAGQPERAARSGWHATAGAGAAMSALGLSVALFAPAIVGWFGAVGEPTSGLAVSFLYIVCAAQPMMAFEFGIGGALRGAGDTRFPLFALFVGLFVFRIGGGLIVLHGFGGSVEAIWACLLLDYATKGALLASRFRGGRWKAVDV